jgi:hypothetical protein
MSEWKPGDKCWLAESDGECVREVTILKLGDGDIPFTIRINDGVTQLADFDDLHETEEDALVEAVELLDKRIRQHALDAAQLVHVRGELMTRYEAVAMPF